MNIICYGDSNTYGFNPEDGKRYETNWVDILQQTFKNDFVVNAGLNGRLAEPRQFLFDLILQQYAPLDLLLLMLGTNNVDHLEPTEHIIASLQAMLKQALPLTKNMILIAPPYLCCDSLRHQRSIEFNKSLKKLAEGFHVGFLDAGKIISSLACDGIHLTQDGHEKLAKEVIEYIKSEKYK